VTTYRVLAEDALDILRPVFPHMRGRWTATAALPGGDLPRADFAAFLTDLHGRRPGFEAGHLLRLARRHGSGVDRFLGDARSLADLGRHFGEGLTEREVLHMKANEWARTVDDVLWRRSKLGLHLLRSQGAQGLAATSEAIARLL
jgi:glycerol-3-phosphate dehydrogenase